MTCELSIENGGKIACTAYVTLRSGSGEILLKSSSENYGEAVSVSASAVAQDVIGSAIEEFAIALDRATVK